MSKTAASRPKAKPSADVMKELANVANSFARTIPETIGTIAYLLLDEKNPVDAEKRLNQAITYAHQIRGSSGTLGLYAINGAFAALEDQLKLVKKQNLLFDEQAMTAIASSIALCRVVAGTHETLLDHAHGEPIHEPAPILTAGAAQEEVEKIVDESKQVVLLIEDDPFFVSIVQAVLSADDTYHSGILSARTLSEAMQLLAECQPDIILLDLALPDSEGIETFHRVYKLAPDVPILILTALDDTPLADKSVAAGAQDYLVKSRISPDGLTRCIRYSINRFRAEKSMLRLRAIEDFNAALAHDLRVPVQGADRILEHILAGQVGELSPELRHALVVLNQSNRELLDRLNKLLNLYRMEFGSVDLHWQDTQLLPVVNSVIEGKMNHINNKGLKVLVDETSIGLNAYTDPQLLREVLDELLENAIKFATNNDTITVKMEGQTSKAAIRVSNTGQPIRKEEMRELFRKFWRGKPGESYVATSGLGLYYCQQVVNVLNGTIACRSNSNLTTFTVRLPSTQTDMVRSI